MKKSFFKKKVVFIPLIIVLAFAFGILFHFYLLRINFIGDVTFHFNFKRNSNVDTHVELYANTPTGRKVNYWGIGDNTYFLRGSYRSIHLTAKNDSTIQNIDSICVKVNNKNTEIDRTNFKKLLNIENNNNYLVAYSLNPNISQINWFEKTLSLVWDFLYNFILYLVIMAIFYFRFYIQLLYRFLSRKGYLILCQNTLKKILLSCFVLLFIYTVVFSITLKFENTVKISGDYPVYQTEAVNFAKGLDLKNQTIFEKYKYDTTNISRNDATYNGSITWVPPAYPVFLSIICYCSAGSKFSNANNN